VLDLEFLGNLAKEAGKAILDVYGTEFSVEQKEDKSPLTLADTRSHQIISAGLKSRYPEIPIISEEGKDVPHSARQGWFRFWLVDPLDGTKEFIKRNDEFTVNIALVEGHTPILGIIYLPVARLLYVGDTRAGECFEISEQGKRPIRVVPSASGNAVRVVKSRSHPSPKLEAMLSSLPSHVLIDRGSSLKFCALAAGNADFYPRFGPTWEWDTAAGHAIVSAAGGVVVDLSGKSLTYNKPDLLNGPFLVASSLEWLERTKVLEIAAGLADM
jgi:3'(2'), 5'-bisphosphate nucleotidase